MRVTSSYHYRMYSGDVTWLKAQRTSTKCAMTYTASQPGSNHLLTGSGRRPFDAPSTNAHHNRRPRRPLHNSSASP